MQKQTMESGVKEKAARWRASGVGYERPHFAFLLNTPALLIVVLLAGYAIVYSAWISLHKFSLKRPRVFDFVGLANYRQILESEAAGAPSRRPSSRSAQRCIKRTRSAQ
jgi:ABC-type sugar transport system permease subunit